MAISSAATADAELGAAALEEDGTRVGQEELEPPSCDQSALGQGVQAAPRRAETEQLLKSRPLLRILVLHGYSSNAENMRAEVHSFRRIFRRVATFEFAEAEQVGEDGYRRWWEEEDEDQFMESCRTLEAKFAGDSKFDVVLGFSQGAPLAAALIARHQQGLCPRPLQFRGAIFFSGYDAAVLRAIPTLRGPGAMEVLKVPSLHIYGLRDNIAWPDESRALAAFFRKARVLSHEGGHKIARGSKVRSAVFSLFEKLTPNAWLDLPLARLDKGECSSCQQIKELYPDSEGGASYCDECWKGYEDYLSDVEAGYLRPWRRGATKPCHGGCVGVMHAIDASL